MDLAHQLGDPTATIWLYYRVRRSTIPPDAPAYVFAAKEAAISNYLDRIERIAKTQGHPAATYVWGVHLSESRGRRKEALEWLKAAGGKGVGEAWVKVGTMLIEDAVETLEDKGRELDLDAYFNTIKRRRKSST